MNDIPTGPGIELAVAVGRIEEMIKSLFTTVKEQAISMRDLDERVRDLEKIVQRIEANQRPATPWWSVAGGIAGIGAIVIAIISVIDVLSNTPTP
jgi:hypothetical protein